jgi:hypothetical protein
MTSQPHRRAGLDGEGVGWAVGAFVASLLIGLLVEPFRGTIGLENVVILYLLVVVAAGEGRIPPGHHRVLDGVMVLPHHVERGSRAGTHHRAVHALRVVGE